MTLLSDVRWMQKIKNLTPNGQIIMYIQQTLKDFHCAFCD